MTGESTSVLCPKYSATDTLICYSHSEFSPIVRLNISQASNKYKHSSIKKPFSLEKKDD